jgi:viroplasmin and RNaseH domain-containing protein
MEEEETSNSQDYLSWVRDLEEKQRILKNRVLLIGQNLIDVKEDFNKSMIEIKKDIETLKSTTEKMKNFLETISGELSKFARKEDLEILSRQAKMFQPLEFVRKSDLESLKRNKPLK